MTRPTPAALERLLAAAAVIAGLVAWAIYFRAGLTLSHYDAKARAVSLAQKTIGSTWIERPNAMKLLPDAGE